MKNQSALITGGTSGIGFATAELLVSRGVNVAISGHRPQDGERTLPQLQATAKKGAQASFISNDVRSEDAVKEMVQQVVADFARLDMAVNNAGIATDTAVPIAQSKTDDFRVMIDTNVMGVDYCMKYPAAQMKAQGAGQIVNLASVAGLNGIAGGSAYCATKHAVVGLTKAAALDYAADNLRINAVAPGIILTPMAVPHSEENPKEADTTAMGALHPMNRIGQPEEVANAIAWLLSEEASFVTGHILCVDGGFQAT
ncbi:MAG: SDR family oxidoreductase [Pelagimonas sp.]|nr:SDR family oxidoreductase [Pelagimonas sp.]